MFQDRQRLLQTELEGYLAGRVTNPENHVSFQPSEGTKIEYPHIVYVMSPAYTRKADNISYLKKDKYEVTYIDRKPASPVFDKLEKRSYTSHKASFVEDGLHHYVFDLYQ